MEISRDVMRGLRLLGAALPDYAKIELCLPDRKGSSVCHRFSVFNGVVHHHGSHSGDAVKAATGPLNVT